MGVQGPESELRAGVTLLDAKAGVSVPSGRGR